MTSWEYLILELPSFEAPTHAPGSSAAVHALNEEGERGWEAVGMTPWLKAARGAAQEAKRLITSRRGAVVPAVPRGYHRGTW